MLLRVYWPSTGEVQVPLEEQTLYVWKLPVTYGRCRSCQWLMTGLWFYLGVLRFHKSVWLTPGVFLHHCKWHVLYSHIFAENAVNSNKNNANLAGFYISVPIEEVGNWLAQWQDCSVKNKTQGNFKFLFVFYFVLLSNSHTCISQFTYTCT